MCYNNFMNVVGVIAEYNPFHKGHLINLEYAKKEGDLVIVLMTGNFNQRGNLSLINKFKKADTGIYYGADIVVELPFPYSLESSDYYSKAALYLLNELKINKLVAGTESGDIKDLKNLALKSINLKKNNKLSLKENFSHYTLPNDTLAISYLKEIIKNNYKIEFITYKRDNGYLKSSTYIRNNLSDFKKLESIIPPYSLNYLKDYKEIDIFNYLKYKILSEIDLSIYHLAGDGLSFKIKKEINKASSLDDLIKRLKSKRYNENRIRKTLIFILLNFKSSDKKELPSYIRVLGFNKKGRRYLKDIKDKTSIPIVSNINDDDFYKLEKETDIIYYFLKNEDIKNYLNKPIIYK